MPENSPIFTKPASHTAFLFPNLMNGMGTRHCLALMPNERLPALPSQIRNLAIDMVILPLELIPDRNFIASSKQWTRQEIKLIGFVALDLTRAWITLCKS